MSDSTDNSEPTAEAEPEAGSQNGEAQSGPQLQTLAQFIKDLSFEIPEGAEALRRNNEGANLTVNVNVEAAQKAEEVYQVSLQLEAKAGSEEHVIYNLEMEYAGLFALKDVPEKMIQPALYIDCAALLFPFARRIIADLTRESNFPPLMLDPIDFGGLFRQKIEQARAQQEQ